MIQVLYMCDAFHSLGVDVTLALPEKGTPIGDNAIAREVEQKIGRSNQYEIIIFPKLMLGNHLHSIGGYWGVKRLLQQVAADVCFVRSPQFLSLAVGAGMKTIYESHNSLLHNRYRALDVLWRARVLHCSKANNLIKFISISQALTDFWIEKGVPADKCLSLHDSIDSTAFQNTLSQPEARKQLHLPGKAKVALYAGSLYKDRGIENILRLAHELPDVRFIILGGPEDRRRYFEAQARAEQLQNIVLPGWVSKEKVRTYLFAADVLLLLFTDKVPTINYCSPLKMFEYMACGRAIVGHAFPTITEVLQHEVTAYLASPSDFEDLLRNVQRALVEQQALSMAEQARKLALDKYTWLRRAETALQDLGVINSKFELAA